MAQPERAGPTTAQLPGTGNRPTQRPFSSIANEPINKGCPVSNVLSLPQPFSSFRVQLPLQACSVGLVLRVPEGMGCRMAGIYPASQRAASCAQDCSGSPHSPTDRSWDSVLPLGSKSTVRLGAGDGVRDREWAEMDCSWFCLGS